MYKEYQYVEDELVIVRDLNTNTWIGTRFVERRTGLYTYNTKIGVYRYCLPMKGNEQLIGTCHSYVKNIATTEHAQDTTKDTTKEVVVKRGDLVLGTNSLSDRPTLDIFVTFQEGKEQPYICLKANYKFCEPLTEKNEYLILS